MVVCKLQICEAEQARFHTTINYVIKHYTYTVHTYSLHYLVSTYFYILKTPRLVCRAQHVFTKNGQISHGCI